MAQAPKTAVDIVFGAMTIGREGMSLLLYSILLRLRKIKSRHRSSASMVYKPQRHRARLAFVTTSWRGKGAIPHSSLCPGMSPVTKIAL